MRTPSMSKYPDDKVSSIRYRVNKTSEAGVRDDYILLHQSDLVARMV